MTQQQLAELLQVSQQQVAKLENPDENPTLQTIERAANALGLDAELSFQCNCSGGGSRAVE